MGARTGAWTPPSPLDKASRVPPRGSRGFSHLRRRGRPGIRGWLPEEPAHRAARATKVSSLLDWGVRSELFDQLAGTLVGVRRYHDLHDDELVAAAAVGAGHPAAAQAQL